MRACVRACVSVRESVCEWRNSNIVSLLRSVPVAVVEAAGPCCVCMHVWCVCMCVCVCVSPLSSLSPMYPFLTLILTFTLTLTLTQVPIPEGNAVPARRDHVVDTRDQPMAGAT